jgi:hypothetical protein
MIPMPIAYTGNPTIQALPPEPLTVITVPEATSPQRLQEIAEECKRGFEQHGMGKCMVVTDGVKVERMGTPLRQLGADEHGNIAYCPSCHEYQRPTPSGRCPGCGAGMEG